MVPHAFSVFQFLPLEQAPSLQGVFHVSMNGNRLVIGVDGGGTKTHGVLFREDGEVLAEGFFPGSNPHSNPEAHVQAALHDLIATLLREGGARVSDIDGICMGMAGCDRPEDKGLIERIVRRKVGTDLKLIIENDAVVAMTAVLGKLNGILVIAGTGSICFGFSEKKQRRRRCGGWGHLIADQGSGYLIGLSAIRAIMDAYDGRRPETALTKRILTDLKLDSPTDLIGWTYISGNGKTEIAALSRFVHEEADKGDEVSVNILKTQATELFDIVLPVYRDLFEDEGETTQLALWGGNLVHAETYRGYFIKAIEESGLPIEPVIREEKAVIGAARYMLQNL